METVLKGIAFADVARAQANLSLVKSQLPPRLWQALPALLAQVPDPDGALNYLERFVRAEPEPAAQALRYVERNPGALHYLLVVFSYSRFLSETLIQHPDLVAWLHRPSRARNFKGGIERVKPYEDLDEEFARFEAGAWGEPQSFGGPAGEQSPSMILARFKRREYLRITLRDVLGLATVADTTFELSQLADVLLARALRWAEQKLQAQYGTPQYMDAAGRAQTARFIILSLGKLGAQELNYSSDVDLMFLYTRDGETSGGAEGATSNVEYFVRLAQSVLKLVAGVTPHGAVFRVDLRLRPQGAEGDVAISIPAALDYYDTRAREWELQMLIKARASAGDVEAARNFLQELHPLVYRPHFNVAAVEAVLNAREGITRTLQRRRLSLMRDAGQEPLQRAGTARERFAAWNVKLSPGGIRDIEFLAQCLQRVYGGADPWLSSAAAAPTLVALQRLHDKGHLSGHDLFRLGAAYQFLRKVEHRLQLRDGLQRHTLPSAGAASPGALERLARRCGVEASDGSAADELLGRVARHFAEVREIYERVLQAHRREMPAAPDSGTTAGAELKAGPILVRLGRGYPALARAAAEVVAQGDAFVRRGLLSFLSAAGLDPLMLARLNSHPEWIPLAGDLFSKSDLAVEMLSHHPEEAQILTHLDSAPHLPSFSALPEVSGTEARIHMGDQLTALRAAYRRAVLATIARALMGRAKPFETFQALTALADQVLALAARLAAHLHAAPEVAGQQGDLARAPFVVLALGRLGTEEMDIGSDADLVFVAGEGLTAEAREEWRRLAERLISVVSSHTREGLFFPVDSRLRPRGTEGEMVQSAAYLREYLSSEAHAWEAATWLKARPVAGNLLFGAEVVQQVRAVLQKRWGLPDACRALARELAELRQKMEREGTGPRARTEFKHLAGGFYDIEYIVALLFFRHAALGGPSGPPGRAPSMEGNVLDQLHSLESSGVLDAEPAEALRAAALLFRSVDHAHRLVTGRTANRPPEPGLAERMVRLLLEWGVPLPSPDLAGLDAALQSARAQTRGIYQQVVLPSG